MKDLAPALCAMSGPFALKAGPMKDLAPALCAMSGPFLYDTVHSCW